MPSTQTSINDLFMNTPTNLKQCNNAYKNPHKILSVWLTSSGWISCDIANALCPFPDCQEVVTSPTSNHIACGNPVEQSSNPPTFWFTYEKGYYPDMHV